LLVVIDVVDEGVQGADALLQAALQPDPLLQRHDARHDVEGDEAFGTFLLAVDGKGDADPMEEGIRLGALLAEPLRGLVLQPMAVARILGPDGAVAEIHFVIRWIGQKVPLSVRKSGNHVETVYLPIIGQLAPGRQ
jgi:hypothetical protein